MTIKEIVKDNIVRFGYYRKGIMYYYVQVGMSYKDVFEFPVPLADMGDATLNAEDKAIYFMRYIRQALDDKTFVPVRSKMV